jgi:hypothetical protein
MNAIQCWCNFFGSRYSDYGQAILGDAEAGVAS